MLPGRACVAGTLRMEFPYQGSATRNEQLSHIGKDARGILCMVQDHRDQRRLRGEARQCESGGIAEDRADLRQGAFIA